MASVHGKPMDGNRELIGLRLSRNRSDILADIAGREIPANCMHVRDGRHVHWDTTPQELEALAHKLGQEEVTVQIQREPDYGLTLKESGTLGVEIRKWVGYRVTLSLTVDALQAMARRLRASRWVEPPEGKSFGSDFHQLKFQLGDDTVTLDWTPELDRSGVRQMTPMEWAALNDKREEERWEELADIEQARIASIPRCTCGLRRDPQDCPVHRRYAS